jgi:5'-nucleotidase
LDPIENVNRVASILKNEKNCDLVICISHLGDKYAENKVSDEVMAKATQNVDLIIGGHTHRFFDKPREYTNKIGEKVLVNQVGWVGIQLGRIDYLFAGKKAKKLDNNQPIWVMENIVE